MSEHLANSVTPGQRRFDVLFEQIEPIAEPIPDGKPEAGEGRAQEDQGSGTKITPELSIGSMAVRFMVFKSDLKSEASGQLLYSPSITAFTGSGDYHHVERRRLDPGSEQASEEFKKIEKLFAWYRRRQRIYKIFNRLSKNFR